ncbi:hypothetical protein [Paraburkholderia phytofirmans]|uniref:Uncharacterized protein n=1 Tax=Paraburkholderia phytofirmans TaxID=261302 RepID=A0ABW9BN19_9BURK
MFGLADMRTIVGNLVAVVECLKLAELIPTTTASDRPGIPTESIEPSSGTAVFPQTVRASVLLRLIAITDPGGGSNGSRNADVTRPSMLKADEAAWRAHFIGFS